MAERLFDLPPMPPPALDEPEPWSGYDGPCEPEDCPFWPDAPGPTPFDNPGENA